MAFVAAVVISYGVFFYLKKTYIGKAIRAVAQNRTAATLMGINIRRIYFFTFGLGTALVGIAGALLMPIYYVFPTVGGLFVLTAFVVVVLGGMGNLTGRVYRRAHHRPRGILQRFLRGHPAEGGGLFRHLHPGAPAEALRASTASWEQRRWGKNDAAPDPGLSGSRKATSSSQPCCALILLPQIVENPFVLHLFIMMLFYAALGGAWNLIGGFGGQLSLGHAAFFGLGAYTSVLLHLHTGLNPWAGMLVGMVVASVVGAAISYPCFRLRGPFFTLATIAFAEVLRILATYFKGLTSGSAGITIPQKMGFSNFMFREKAPYLYIILIFALLVFLISYLIEKSRFGYYLQALREDEDAAESLGINSPMVKLKAAVISAALTSIGGVFYAQYILFIEPYSEFSLDFSIQLALIPMIGGMGTSIGPVIGSFVLTPLQELLRSWMGGGFAGLYLVIYGIILILVVIFMPQGILGLFQKKEAASKEDPAPRGGSGRRAVGGRVGRGLFPPGFRFSPERRHDGTNFHKADCVQASIQEGEAHEKHEADGTGSCLSLYPVVRRQSGVCPGRDPDRDAVSLHRAPGPARHGRVAGRGDGPGLPE